MINGPVPNDESSLMSLEYCGWGSIAAEVSGSFDRPRNEAGTRTPALMGSIDTKQRSSSSDAVERASATRRNANDFIFAFEISEFGCSNCLHLRQVYLATLPCGLFIPFIRLIRSHR